MLALSQLARSGRRITVLFAVTVLLLTGAPATSVAQTPTPLPAGTYVVAVGSTDDTQSFVEALDIEVDQEYEDVIAGFSAELTSEQATELAVSDQVVGIAQERIFVGFSQTVPPSISTVEADQAPVFAGNGVTNWTGPAVAVMDSGSSMHPDLNVQGEINCSTEETMSDDGGHSTGVMGRLGAIDNSFGVVGVAPGVPMYSVKVLDRQNRGTLSNLLCGLDWIAANAEELNIKVVNMSLGTRGSDTGSCGISSGDTFHQAICSLESEGITLVGAAGTGAMDMAGFVPGAYDEVLTATAFADFDGVPGRLSTPPCTLSNAGTDDEAWPSSPFAVSEADKAHVVAAPATCIFTTMRGNRYGYMHPGTSMAAATVSGVVLNCMATGGSCIGMEPAQVRSTIIAQAAASASRGKGFVGDPNSPIEGRYYGYPVSTVPTGPTPTPTPTPDTTAPTVSVTSPGSGSTISGMVAFHADANDNVGVTRVEFRSGATLLSTASLQPSGSWRALINTAQYPPGAYPIVATAIDAAGNVGTSRVIYVRVVH